MCSLYGTRWYNFGRPPRNRMSSGLQQAIMRYDWAMWVGSRATRRGGNPSWGPFSIVPTCNQLLNSIDSKVLIS